MNTTPDTPRTAFFRLDGEMLIANDPARGPWHADACHGGPVTGAVARALEQAIADKQLVRLSLSLVRPVSIHGFTVRTDIIRNGRAATTAIATLSDKEGRICAHGHSLHLASYGDADLPTTTVPAPRFAEATNGAFPILQARHDLPSFLSFAEAKYPPGEDASPGPTTVWLRTGPLVEGETATPFQTLCQIADCGNAFSRNAEIDEVSFVNPDLSINIFRPPVSDWLASDSRSFYEPNGLGLSQAMLFDTRGPIGTATQSLIIRRTDT